MSEPILDTEAPVEETVQEEENTTPQFDMGMSDEDFEKTDFEELSESLPETSDTVEEEEVLDESGEDPEESVEATEEPVLDKAAEYDKIMAEFKANGKMMSVDNSDDVRKLMMMGAGFNKKMEGLKSQRKFIKMLQNNDLLDESKLSYLIDLDKKNPDAIAKLLKDSELDPMDIDTQSDTDYKPNAYTVDDKQVQLDAVIEDLQDSSGYATTIDIVGNKWDESSRQILTANPELLRTINSHVEAGIYDQIASVVEKEKMLGKLQGVDDFTAYRTVGDAMNANGAFDKPQAVSGVPVTPPAKKADPQVNDKKRAASTVKAKPRVAEQFNISDLSDEEFEKKFGSSL
jgi:hypothetical protein